MQYIENNYPLNIYSKLMNINTPPCAVRTEIDNIQKQVYKHISSLFLRIYLFLLSRFPPLTSASRSLIRMLPTPRMSTIHTCIFKY